MKYLPDVNVLFPLLVSRHPHRGKALAWFDGTNIGETTLCRLTRLGVLRLLCTPRIMGPDVLQPKAAMTALEALELTRGSPSSPNRKVDATLKTLVANAPRPRISGPTPI